MSLSYSHDLALVWVEFQHPFLQPWVQSVDVSLYGFAIVVGGCHCPVTLVLLHASGASPVSSECWFSNGAVIVSAVSLRTFGCRRSGPGDFDSFSDRSSSCTMRQFQVGHGVSTGCISHVGWFLSSFVKTDTKKVV